MGGRTMAAGTYGGHGHIVRVSGDRVRLHGAVLPSHARMPADCASERRSERAATGAGGLLPAGCLGRDWGGGDQILNRRGEVGDDGAGQVRVTIDCVACRLAQSR